MKVYTYKVYMLDEDHEQDNCQHEEAHDYIAMCYHNALKIDFIISNK